MVELEKQILGSIDPGVRGSLEGFTIIGMCLDLCGLGVRLRNVRRSGSGRSRLPVQFERAYGLDLQGASS
jgi:hypothetical protein